MVCREIPQRGATRQVQSGSVEWLVMLVVLAGLIWWQWDWISGLSGGVLSMGGGPVAEVLDYRCEPQSNGKLTIDGHIRNASNAPIGFRAVTALYDSSGKKSDYVEATLRPSPIQPGQDGSFQTEGPALPDGGNCKLDSVLDSDTGRLVRHTGVRR
jgi:hypothetical protein